MANDVKFESKERRMPKIEACLAEYGIAMGLAFLVIPVVEIVKLIQRWIKK